MKNLIGLVVGLVISTSTIVAQDNHGYYGKKTYLDVNANIFSPLIYNFTNYEQGYKRSPSGNSLVNASEEWFKVGARLTLSRAVKTNVGLGLEIGFDRYTLQPEVAKFYHDPNFPPNTYNTSVSVARHESVIVNSILVMPKIEFSGLNGLLPNGLVHQVGIGVTFNKPVEKEYLVEISPNSEVWQFVPEDYQPPDVGRIIDLTRSHKMIRFMYGLKMRTPLSKSLLISYGFQYNLDFSAISSDYPKFLGRAIQRYQFTNIISLDVGLTLPF